MFFKIDDTYSIYRSRHTGDWGLWEKNPVYGYDAALRYFGQRLTMADLEWVAQKIDVPLILIVGVVEARAREGSAGIRPDPEFVFLPTTQL